MQIFAIIVTLANDELQRSDDDAECCTLTFATATCHFGCQLCLTFRVVLAH